MQSQKEIISKLPKEPGVYIFKNAIGKVIYVGKAVRLKDRVSSYFQKGLLSFRTKLMISQVHDISYIPVTSELEALLLEAHLIKKHQPYFNIREKDDKHSAYIKITTNDEFPRVFITRDVKTDTTYFGPFYTAKPIRQALKLIRHIFPFDTQRNIGKKPCFWNHLGLCDPCPSYIVSLDPKKQLKEKKRYKRNIKQLIKVLSRKTDVVKKDLLLSIYKASRSEQFEEAAVLRDKLTKLEYVMRPYQNLAEFLENPNLLDDIRNQELTALYRELSPHIPYAKAFVKIECFDASHTAMEKPVVGMSVFIDGTSEKKLYRKFRIYGSVRDDLDFLEEALRRRFKHKEWEYPDLLIIDGGKTQVKRAKIVLEDLTLKIPLIGVVKPFDDVVIPHTEGFLTIRLKNDRARHLLARIRDEAHRFSRAYHIALRARARYT